MKKKELKEVTKSFKGKDIRATDMSNTAFVKCDFTDAIMQGCDFTNSTFKDCKFDNTDTRWTIGFNEV